ncbi:MAG: 3-deoxy-D-manno-octulosonic acid transferase [Pseudomonadota bacterium]
MASTSRVLSLYRNAGYLLAPALGLLLDRRTRRGKEDPARRDERYGIASVQRPPGPLVWVHAASVGETNAVIPVIQAIAERGLAILLTTGTVTSAAIARDALPAGAIHQYVPFDVEPYVTRFLDHWSPDLALFAESEIWPLTLAQLGDRSIPVVILNGRISARSAAHWSRSPRFSGEVFGNIDLCLAQSERDATLYAGLGVVSARAVGNLKFDRDAPPFDAEALAHLKDVLAGRRAWIAASTHQGEEALALTAHAALMQSNPDALLILVPRHPQRGPDVAQLVKIEGLTAAIRSAGDEPSRNVSVYIADTIGDLGLLYRLSEMAFVGGSFVERGGQNPVEPAQLNVPILHGPNVRNFKDIYRDLNEVGGALRCDDAEVFRDVVLSLWSDVDRRRTIAEQAAAYVREQRGALARTLDALTPFIDPLTERVPARTHR